MNIGKGIEKTISQNYLGGQLASLHHWSIQNWHNERINEMAVVSKTEFMYGPHGMNTYLQRPI